MNVAPDGREVVVGLSFFERPACGAQVFSHYLGRVARS